MDDTYNLLDRKRQVCRVLIQSKKNDHYLTFNDTSHRYTLDGEHVPGVTTFIHGGYVTSQQLISWMKGQTAAAMFEQLTFEESGTWQPKGGLWPVNKTKRDELIKEAKARDKKTSGEAADIGTFTHDYAYYTETNQPDKLLETDKRILLHPDKDKIISCIEKFKDWKQKNVDVMVASEEIVASVEHDFGGKFDRLTERNGVLVLSDFKTSSGIFIDQKIQLAAYRLAIREWMGLDVKAIEILRFGKEDGTFETELVDKPETLQELEEQAIRCRKTYAFASKYAANYKRKKI